LRKSKALEALGETKDDAGEEKKKTPLFSNLVRIFLPLGGEMVIDTEKKRDFGDTPPKKRDKSMPPGKRKGKGTKDGTPKRGKKKGGRFRPKSGLPQSGGNVAAGKGAKNAMESIPSRRPISAGPKGVLAVDFGKIARSGAHIRGKGGRPLLKKPQGCQKNSANGRTARR